MAEGTSLLRTRTGNCTEGSNPSLSVLSKFIRNSANSKYSKIHKVKPS